MGNIWVIYVPWRNQHTHRIQGLQSHPPWRLSWDGDSGDGCDGSGASGSVFCTCRKLGGSLEVPEYMWNICGIIGLMGLPISFGNHLFHPLSTINGNARILKWRYCTICLAIFCGDIALDRPYAGLIYGRYLQWIGSWNGHGLKSSKPIISELHQQLTFT